MSQSSRRSALGRGLSALIPGADAPEPREVPTASPTTLPIARIHAAHHQPRTTFDDARLAELADSIRTNGILQPIVVREADAGAYVIIAGERRFRAAGLAGLTEVPVVIRDATDAEAFELALVENIQREDLDPIEEAQAYRHLMESHSLTQDQVARRVGKDRVTIANSLRLLKLPESIRDDIAAGLLTAGHARALLTATEDRRLTLARQAIDEGWSVRETERRARAKPEEPDPVADAAGEQPDLSSTAGDQPDPTPKSAAIEAVEDQLRAAIGAPVRLVHRAGRGRIEIRFHSLDELERLIELITQLEGA